MMLAIYRTSTAWAVCLPSGGVLLAATLAEAMDLAYRLASGVG